MTLQRPPSFALGYHGTTRRAAFDLLHGVEPEVSNRPHDWLGRGFYFWENDPERAWQWARDRAPASPSRDKEPMVVGAVIDLGHCLNLYDQPALQEVDSAYRALKASFDAMGQDMPTNRASPRLEQDPDAVLRFLDRAVIEEAHRLRARVGAMSFQTVRAGFHEGGSLFPRSRFCAKNHIQISVRDVSCIRGFFLPRH